MQSTHKSLSSSESQADQTTTARIPNWRDVAWTWSVSDSFSWQLTHARLHAWQQGRCRWCRVYCKRSNTIWHYTHWEVHTAVLAWKGGQGGEYQLSTTCQAGRHIRIATAWLDTASASTTNCLAIFSWWSTFSCRQATYTIIQNCKFFPTCTDQLCCILYENAGCGL